ncbi:MAG: hypothetical protein R6V10_16350 [bacterium]
MIKTVQFDITASLVLGLVVPLLCPAYVKQARYAVRNWYFMALVMFQLFFFIPLGTYLYFYYPDWSLMFFADPAAMDPVAVRLTGLFAVSGYMIAAMAGFAVSATLIRKNRARQAWMAFAVLAAGLGLFSLITMPRLMEVGTYAEFTASPKETVFLYGHTIGYVIPVVALLAAAALITMFRIFRKAGMRPT